MLKHPETRDGYLIWLSQRIEGFGNENLEPIKSLVADGYVELVDKPHSTPTRITAAGRDYLASRPGLSREKSPARFADDIVSALDAGDAGALMATVSACREDLLYGLRRQSWEA